MLRVADLVGPLPPPDLGLDENGIAAQPALVIDTDAGRAELDPQQIASATARIAQAAPLTIALTTGRDVLEPIARAADISLAHTDAHDDGMTVNNDDPTAEATRIAEAVRAHPRAALTLAWLLRATVTLDVAGALAAESAAYSMLLAGSEFQAWLNGRPPARPAGPPERVRLDRTGDELTINLARPARRNAFDSRMRDALAAALHVAELDPDVHVTLRGDGPSFSAGGDLDEFGTAADPAAAHIVRVAASPAAALHRLRDRVTARVHGPCIGAGLELPAFAGHVIAHADTTFGLPEIAMGLIPGAGGTVSIPRRIGRHRTTWLALSGRPLSASTAAAWGLIDRIE